MLLVPPYLVYVRAARPFIAFYNWCANVTLRAFGVEPKDELEVTVSTRRAVRDDRRVAVGGPARPRGAQPADPGAADPQPRGRRRGGAARRDPRGAGRRRRARVRRSAPSSRRWPRPATPASRSPTPTAPSSATCTSRTCCRWSTTRDAVVDPAMVRPLPRVPASLPLPDALSRLRRNNSHLALVTDADGRGHGDGGAGGPGRGPGRHRPRRDAPCLSAARRRDRCSTSRLDRPRSRRTASASSASSRRTARAAARRSRTRCGTSCSPTTACGRGSCGAGIPASASSLGGRRRDRYLDRSGYAPHGGGVTVTRELSAWPRRHRARSSPDLLRATASRPARLNCFGLHEWAMVYRAPDGAPRPGAAAARGRGHRRRRRVNAVAVQPLRRLPVLHRAGRAAQRRAR